MKAASTGRQADILRATAGQDLEQPLRQSRSVFPALSQVLLLIDCLPQV